MCKDKTKKWAAEKPKLWLPAWTDVDGRMHNNERHAGACLRTQWSHMLMLGKHGTFREHAARKLRFVVTARCDIAWTMDQNQLCSMSATKRETLLQDLMVSPQYALQYPPVCGGIGAQLLFKAVEVYIAVSNEPPEGFAACRTVFIP